jgi:hypothetical protein
MSFCLADAGLEKEFYAVVFSGLTSLPSRSVHRLAPPFSSLPVFSRASNRPSVLPFASSCRGVLYHSH